MKAIRIFNNNAVSTLMPNQKEAILIGPGIGFNKRPNDSIDESKIEKIYYVQTEIQTRFMEALDNTSPEVLEVAEAIIDLAKQNGLVISNQGTISLLDHINFSLDRAKENIFLPNLMLTETKMIYPKEYQLGLKSLDLIEQYCGIRLPNDEAGYIALHLVSVSIDKLQSYNTLKLVKGCLDIISKVYNVKLNENSLELDRLTTHLKFLSQRIIANAPWTSEQDDAMYELLIHRHPKNQEAISQLCEYIKTVFKYELNRQEQIYLLVHLNRIL